MKIKNYICYLQLQHQKIINICAFCDYKFKIEELLVDGFYVEDDDYIAYLQTGIRVPVSKEIYEEWIMYKEINK